MCVRRSIPPPTTRVGRRRAPLALLILLAGCNVTTDVDRDTFFLSFAASPVPTSAGVTIVGGGHTLVVTSAEFVVDDVALERAGSAADCDAMRDAECSMLAEGPLRVALPIRGNAAVVTPIQVTFPERLYRELEMDLHVPTAETNPAFVAAHPDFDGASVRVAGTWDGVPFSLARAIDAEVEIPFAEIFRGDENWNLTVAVAVRGWFDDGGTPFDPATAAAGGANAALFRANLLASFDAFRDLNRDGVNDAAP